ncbi:hypothetical protein [Nocardioides marmorisolisilvae]|uniref:N-acetyltransferase domain-containing protein n=1 Tax=Nocardioides marmorisolisilvae TaxID=1542737 RepID=A0A3N0DTW1_9ACTN|nr:hypothetical protein [Nocardioides marmorisolisilvae]RNL79059.1 hypothetical protein EFL95_08455 [Nocardioides marmorisolisilvae]
MSWLDAVGWLGSALLIYSVMQARVLRFRVLNLAACVVLIGFNAALGIWPMVAMNIALCLINIWHIRHLVRTRDDEASYAVLEVGGQDEYLRHVLRVHEDDILAFQPDLVWDGAGTDHLAFVVQRGDETVGIVLLRVEGTTARVLLDYVTPRYRDFSPGRFVWRSSGVLAGRGISTVVTSPTMVGAYYQRLGFSPRDDGSYELAL